MLHLSLLKPDYAHLLIGKRFHFTARKCLISKVSVCR